jgi:hypothetical protein
MVRRPIDVYCTAPYLLAATIRPVSGHLNTMFAILLGWTRSRTLLEELHTWLTRIEHLVQRDESDDTQVKGHPPGALQVLYLHLILIFATLVLTVAPHPSAGARCAPLTSHKHPPSRFLRRPAFSKIVRRPTNIHTQHHWCASRHHMHEGCR